LTTTTSTTETANSAADQKIKQEAEKMVADYVKSGQCCSEAIANTILALYGEEPSQELLNSTTGFCGGIGASHEDICGALTGGVIATSSMLEDSKEAKVLAAQFRNRFLQEFGSTSCGDLFKMGSCPGKITSTATGLLLDVLAENEHYPVESSG
jgi:C_GCAxxG_C_C family probable redox protein